MATKIFLRPNSLPLSIVSPLQLFFFPKYWPVCNFAVLSLLSTATQALKALPYGPALQKGKNPSQYPLHQHYYQSQFAQIQCDEDAEQAKIGNYDDDGDDDDKVINEEEFTRIFDLAALRVPAKDCFSLESRLRGHLLNWPRIRNIARVPGDEVEEGLVSLLGEAKNRQEDEEGNLDVLNRRIYGKAEGDGEELCPVLYRERLAKEFNSRGFVKFRNLAKISRPKRKRKERREDEGAGNGRKGRNEFAVVEVVEEKDEEEDWKGLLGDEFKGSRKWRGSTRLLLLDERYAEKGVEELPEAIKVSNLNSFNYL